MKKICLFSFLIISCFGGFAQVTFSTRIETYVPLSGAKLHSDTVKWDDPDTDLTKPMAKLGFNFQGMGIQGDTIVIGESWVYLPGTNWYDAMYVKAVGVDMVDRGYKTSTALSPISSMTIGTAGDRIFKIEFKNFGFKAEYNISATLKDFGNIQIWFYEKGNFIEIHYGSFSVAKNTSYGGFSGLNIYCGYHNLNNKSLKGIALEANQANPTIIKDTYNGILIGHPELGRVYRFQIPLSASVSSEKTIPIKVYPQPANDVLHVELPEQSEPASFQIHSIAGELISEGVLENNTINLETLRSGLFILKVEQNGKLYHTVFHKF